MKKIFLILTIITSIFITNSFQDTKISAYNPNPNHRFSFDKSGSYDESTAYTPLHNLMGMGQNAEFDITPNTYNGGDLWLWHPSSHPSGPFTPVDRVEKLSNKSFFSTSSDIIAKANVMKFSDFITKYSKYYPHMVIEVKNFNGKAYLLDRFINNVKSVKDKIEIQSFNAADLKYLHSKGYDKLDLLVNGSFNKYSQLKLDTWKDMGINRLLINQDILNKLKTISKLNLNWKSFDVGFWTINTNEFKQKFKDFVDKYGSNFKSCYYISDNNSDVLSTRISELVNLLKQKYTNERDVVNYLIKLREYNNGKYLLNEASYNIWKDDFINHELANDNKYSKDEEVSWFNNQNFGLYKYKKAEFLKNQLSKISKVHGMVDQLIWRESITNLANIERKNEGVGIINSFKFWSYTHRKDLVKIFGNNSKLYSDVNSYIKWKNNINNVKSSIDWFNKQNFGIYKYLKVKFLNSLISKINVVYGINNVKSWQSMVYKKAIDERKKEAKIIVYSKRSWSKRTKSTNYSKFIKYTSNYSNLTKYNNWKGRLSKIR